MHAINFIALAIEVTSYRSEFGRQYVCWHLHLTTVQHKTLAGENFGGFGGFPVNRQNFIHQIL